MDGKGETLDFISYFSWLSRRDVFASPSNLEKFTSNLKGFLDEYMESNSELGEESVSEHRERFNAALRICGDVFGDDAFVNPTAVKKRKGLVHYDLVMTTVGELSEDVALQNASSIRQAYASLCESEEFKLTLAGGLQDKSRILRRRNKWKELLEAAINA